MSYEQAFIAKLELNYDEFSQWLVDNTPAQWSPSDTRDLLAYIGFVHFMQISEKMPGFTITDLDQVVFGNARSNLQ